MIIKPDTPVETLLDEFPESNGWLLKKRLHCTECGEPVWGTISELILSSGMDADAVLGELNEFLALAGYGDKSA